MESFANYTQGLSSKVLEEGSRGRLTDLALSEKWPLKWSLL